MRKLFLCLLSTYGVALAGCGQSFCDGGDCGHDHGAVTQQVQAPQYMHPTEGPHHGDLVELGDEEFHAEIVHDDATGTVTAYVLDSSATLAVPITATEIFVNLSHDGHAEQFRLAANPQPSDPPGNSSMFTSTDAELAEDLDNEDAKAQLVVKIGGKPYRGAIQHGHDHDEGHLHDDDEGHHHAHDEGQLHDEDEEHHHAHGDALIWQRSEIQHSSYAISLGHHSTLLHAGEPVEPAVSITRNGAPVSDAQVHNSLWSGDGTTLLAAEVRTTYEPRTAEEPAHYAQGNLNIPRNAKNVVIRFRVVLPGDAGEVSYDLPVLTEHESSVASDNLREYN